MMRPSLRLESNLESPSKSSYTDEYRTIHLKRYGNSVNIHNGKSNLGKEGSERTLSAVVVRRPLYLYNTNASQ